MKLNRVAITVAMLGVALLASADVAEGRVGKLDPSFGERGRFVTPSDRFGPSATDLARGLDGSTVVVHGARLIRLLPDGRLDQAFGDGGTREIAEMLDGRHIELFDVSIDSEGRVLGFGAATDSTQTYTPQLMFPTTLAASWAFVFRLRADGELDPSFGDGTGMIRADFGLSTQFPTDLPLARVLAGIIDSHDRPVLLVGAPGLRSPCYGKTGVDWFPQAVVRLTTTGTLDASFGGGAGIRPVDGVNAYPTPDLLVDQEDELLVAGAAGNACPQGAIVARFSSDGVPPTGFGENGVRVFPRLTFSALGPGGEMIFRRGWRPTTRVIRMGSDGARDSRFGKKGSVSVSMPPGARRSLRPVAVDEEGRILLAGSFTLPKPTNRASRKPVRSLLAVGRLRPNGELDRSFGRRGWIATPFSRGQQVVAKQAALDPQGRLLVVGSVDLPQRRGGKAVLVRYLLDG